ncbi:Scaffold protein for [4Fe-4S] cluster assembly ApbC [Rhodovulum sp. PH10]|uniref:iron-sulfur cluster carrier protein ApbC n=1 Tax=Rhodovulum sp. PH10 TaxID=1187851 RepID=UPI00027C28FD|nr:iron-sulfur cluster carrier protein ApbC [Rhodovulum sp. PH10]EJW11736.1 Scaffold protein for [4Fe-4S] cluster assembly ApbC [Rhodovulum sp. PH10]
MAISRDQVLAALSRVTSPGGVALPDTGTLSEIVVSEGKVFFSIAVDAGAVKAWEPVREAAERAVRAIPGVSAAMVALTAERAPGSARPTPVRTSGPAGGAGNGGAPHGHAHPHAHPHPQGQPPQQPGIPGVAAIIAVASGKGGVGKSTTAVNIALGLQAIGQKVGLLDADIYGPSVPRLLGLKGRPTSGPGNKLLPLKGFGLEVMSIGFLVEEETPMIWRGPMVMSALTQMLREVDWGQLDVLVVDMPPGTGDAQLTMAQQVPLKGAVIVSTPQDLALIDARRGIAMFRRVDVPVLGIVENMSYFLCPKCGERSDVFGHGGAQTEAARLGVPFLGEVPLHMAIRETSDAGKPVVATEPDGPHAKIYREIATQVRDQLAATGGARQAPKIVVE